MKTIKNLLIALALIVSAQAAPIQITYTGQGSGSIGSTSFTDANFTISAWGDTTNRQDNGAAFWIDHDSVTIDIAGNVYDFITATRTFYNYGLNTPGFSRAGSGGMDLLNGPFSPASLAGWDMLTSTGTIPGSLYLFQWTSAGGVQTDGGTLVFADGFTDGTFTATVPEAGSSLALLGAALLGFAALRRRLVA